MMHPHDEALVEALMEAADRAYRTLKEAHPEARFYFYGLFVNRDVLFVGPTAGSKEGLRAAATKSGESGAKRKLRWSSSHSPHHLAYEEHFEPVQALLDARPDPYELEPDDFAAEVGTRLESCFEALRRLDAAKLFGEGPERHALLINVFAGDQTDKTRLEYASRLNPPEAVSTLQRALQVREPTGVPTLLGEHAFQVADLSFRADVLAAAGTRGELFAWRVQEDGFEELLAVLDEDQHWAIALDADGKLLYGSTGGVRRRAFDDEEPVVVLDREERVTQLALSPDDSMLIVDEGYERLIALDAHGVQQWTREPGGRPLAFSPDGSVLAAAASNGECVALLDPKTGSERGLVACGGTTAAAFGGENGNVIAVASPHALELYAKSEGWGSIRKVAVAATANALAYSPNGQLLAGAFDDGKLRIWSAKGELQHEVNGYPESLLAVCWLGDDRVAASGRDLDESAAVYIWTLSKLDRSE